MAEVLRESLCGRAIQVDLCLELCVAIPAMCGDVACIAGEPVGRVFTDCRENQSDRSTGARPPSDEQHPDNLEQRHHARLPLKLTRGVIACAAAFGAA